MACSVSHGIFGLFGLHIIGGLVIFLVSDVVCQAMPVVHAMTHVGRADRLALTIGVINW